MGDEAVEISNLLLEVVRPFVARLCALGVLQKIDVQMVCFVPYYLEFVPTPFCFIFLIR